MIFSILTTRLQSDLHVHSFSRRPIFHSPPDHAKEGWVRREKKTQRMSERASERERESGRCPNHWSGSFSSVQLFPVIFVHAVIQSLSTKSAEVLDYQEREFTSVQLELSKARIHFSTTGTIKTASSLQYNWNYQDREFASVQMELWRARVRLSTIETIKSARSLQYSWVVSRARNGNSTTEIMDSLNSMQYTQNC